MKRGIFLLVLAGAIGALFPLGASLAIEKQNIAVATGILFVVLGVVEFRSSFGLIKVDKRVISGLRLFLSGCFLFIFSVPILVLRLAHWNEDFSGLSIFGIGSGVIHQAATWNFVAYSVSVLLIELKNKRPLS